MGSTADVQADDWRIEEVDGGWQLYWHPPTTGIFHGTLSLYHLLPNKRWRSFVQILIIFNFYIWQVLILVDEMAGYEFNFVIADFFLLHLCLASWVASDFARNQQRTVTVKNEIVKIGPNVFKLECISSAKVISLNGQNQRFRVNFTGRSGSRFDIIGEPGVSHATARTICNELHSRAGSVTSSMHTSQSMHTTLSTGI